MGLALVHSEFCDLATTAAAHDHPDLGAGATEDRDVRIQDPGVEAGQRDMAYDAGREARDFEVTEGHAEVVGEGHHVAELEAARTGDEVVASSAKGCLAPWTKCALRAVAVGMAFLQKEGEPEPKAGTGPVRVTKG